MVKKESFGRTKNGCETFIYRLKNEKTEAAFTNFGAAIVEFKVLDKNHKKTDIVLGYDDVSKYEDGEKYLGATIGRCSNRIKDGIVEINNQKIQVSQNENSNQLHGGFEGFDKKIWQAATIQNGIEFSYLSPEGEEGYPGNLFVKVRYTLIDSSLIINYNAVSDKETVCALTNHSYFNLEGFDSGDISKQQVQIFADSYTRNDNSSLPTGEIIPVNETPMDFRCSKPIGQDINSEYDQLAYAGGFDNNWIINRKNNEKNKIIKAAQAYSQASGIILEVFTDLPGVQFYSGNYLDGSSSGKQNMPIKNRYGFCLECQYFPNAFANKNFPLPVLKKGEVYNKTIIYKTSLI